VGETLLDDGRCQPAGLPLDAPACPPGEAPLDGGGCLPAGVPADACGEGFMTDGNGGCEAILPPAPCPKGMMAVPGMTTCQDVAPCGAGTWGDIPVDATTQYVDQAYAGGGSDGSAAKPWTTIHQGIDAAGNGAIVAVAAGVYAENMKLFKQVRLWGRCPALVEVAGPDPKAPSILLESPSAGAEIHDIGISGQWDGLGILQVHGVIVDRVWIHDTNNFGLFLLQSAESVTVTGSLIEGAHGAGVFVDDSTATLDQVVVRDTLPDSTATNPGVGVVTLSETAGALADATIRRSLVERNHYAGVYLQNGNATVESTMVRDTEPDPQLQGAGVLARHDTIQLPQPSLTVRASVIAHNYQNGVSAISANATLESTVVRDTQSTTANPNGPNDGTGVQCQINVSAGKFERPSVTVKTSLIDNNSGNGVTVATADLTLESTIIRSTQPDATGRGRGLAAINALKHGRPNVTMRASVIEGSVDTGLAVGGGDALIESSVVRGTLANSQEGMWGQGIDVISQDNDPSNATIRGCLVEDNLLDGVAVVGSTALIESTVVRDTQAPPSAPSGRGIEIHAYNGVRASATIQSSLVEHNVEAGIIVEAADVTITSTLVRDTASNTQGQYGDGIVVLATAADPPDPAGPAKVSIAGSRVEASARAGLSNFGSDVAFANTALVCSAFDIEGDQQVTGENFSFENGGGNACGCPEASGECKVVSMSIAPPKPIKQ
jgi:hypothetical protein